MEALSLARALPLRHADSTIPRSTRHVSLGSFRRRRSGGRCVAVRSVIGGDTKDFSSGRQRKEVEAEEEEKSRQGGGGGLVIGEERDESDSLVGLSFVPPSAYAIRATIRDSPASNSVQGSRGRSPSPSPRPPPQRSGTFHFTSTPSRKELDKRTVSPKRFPLVRSGSLASRPVTPTTSRPTTPNPIRHPTPNFIFPGSKYPLEASMRLHAGREKGTETEQHPSKSKRLLKALLSRRKSKKDETLYTYLDDY